MSDLEVEEAPADVTSGDTVPLDMSNGREDSRWPSTNAPIAGVRVGVVVGLKDEGRTPLVVFPGQHGSAAVGARSTIDLHGGHVGREVVLMFEDGDARQPIVLGCFTNKEGGGLSDRSGQVKVDVDGERLMVTAKTQLVLRCGKASLTLTKEGKVLIQGTYVSSRSSGVNRIKGGSVQLN